MRWLSELLPPRIKRFEIGADALPVDPLKFKDGGRYPERLNAARLPFITVLTDPTMGGVSASFALLQRLPAPPS